MTGGRPLMLDLFCGAGGAAVGYDRAGFDVVGVDIKPQPHYPFPFHRLDAFEALAFFDGRTRTNFAAIHASPPCQAYSTTRTLHVNEYPALVARTRVLLAATGLPFVIENVVGAPLDPFVQVCGSAFGLGVRRHRNFESNRVLFSLGCDHASQSRPIDVTGGGPSVAPRLDGKGGRSRKPVNIAEASTAMGIDWMNRAELNEAIPPAYTEFIGEQLIDQLRRVA